MLNAKITVYYIANIKEPVTIEVSKRNFTSLLNFIDRKFDPTGNTSKVSYIDTEVTDKDGKDVSEEFANFQVGTFG